MEHSAKADFHGGLGRKGSWRAPFVFYIPAINKAKKKPPAELGAFLITSGYLRCQIDQFT
jgi:hypothetical protein